MKKPDVLAAACVLLLGGACPTRAVAQTPTPAGPESMPVHIGPLGLDPSVSIANIGIDSNVFNDPSNPQKDFTFTVTPRLEAKLRTGRLLLGYTSVSDLVYFHKFASERSANSGTDARMDVNLGRLQPYVLGSWLSTRQRLNAEVDKRAPRTQRILGAGVRTLVGSRTALLLEGRRQDSGFKDGATFRGVDLSRTLHARTDTGSVALQMILTPLTTFALSGSVQQDRFPSAHERDSDTFRVMPSVQFDPTSLLRGSLAVGYRRFRPRDATVPDYSGLVIQGSLGYTLLDRTRFAVDLQRDVQYSYEELEPYYLATGGRLSITQQLVGRFDVQGLAGRQIMSYRAAGASGETRRDQVDTFGAGVGVRIRDNMRLGVNWERARRQSALSQSQYESRRLFASLTVGI